MTLTALAETADVFGIADSLDFGFRRFSQTTVYVNAVSPDVGEVLGLWDRFASASHTPPAPEDESFPRDPVAAVDHISRHLGLPRERVLAALRIAPRTYYGWKSKGRRARPQSLGVLWSMTEAVHFMARAHPHIAGWFGANKDAQARFDAGDVQGLVQLELDWALRTYHRPIPTAPDFGDANEIAGDIAVDMVPDNHEDRAHRTTSFGVGVDDVAEVVLTRRARPRA